MKIKLGTKTYHTKELMFEDVYKATEMALYFNNGGSKSKDPLGEYDKMAEFYVDLFNDQFTIDDVKQKLPAKGAFTDFILFLNEIQSETVVMITPKNEPAIPALES